MARTPYIADVDFTLYVGDVREVLRDLPDESVHCVVTSPPFWGLRDYGTASWEGGDPLCEHRVGGQVPDGKALGAITAGVRPGVDASVCRSCGAVRVDQQLGLEGTPAEYVDNMVQVFGEVRRVLRRDGSCWLNLGDSYNTQQAGNKTPSGFSQTRPSRRSGNGDQETVKHGRGLSNDLKPKDLVGIPWRVAFALQADGWYLRSDIIWAKTNPMPESVVDRPTKAHEYIFLLTRSPQYFFDPDAVREPAEWARWGKQTNEKHEGSGTAASWIGTKSKAELQARKSGNKERKPPSARDADLGRGAQAGSVPWEDDGRGRNIRTVWEITTQPYPEAHFATFPQELPRRCIKAGTSEKGCCPQCNAPWERDSIRIDQGWDGSRYGEHAVDATGGAIGGGTEKSTLGSSGGKLTGKSETIGWQPTCECFGWLYRWRDELGGQRETYVWRNLDEEGRIAKLLKPAVVMDPFMGSGTTAHVARSLRRHSVGIELSPEYAELIANRTRQLSLLS